MALPRPVRALSLLTFFLATLPLSAHAGRPLRDCLARLPAGVSVFQVGALSSSAEVLEAAGKAIPALCRNLIGQEAQGTMGALGNNCLLTDEDSWRAASGALKPRQRMSDEERTQADALQARCEKAISAEDVARANPAFSSNYQRVLAQEQAAGRQAAAQQAEADRLATARATVRDFDLKGLRIGIQPVAINALDPQAKFECLPDNASPLASHCRARFSQRLCENEELVHPVSGEPLLDPFGHPRYVERCQNRFPAGTPSHFGTFGGARVHYVDVTYYDAVSSIFEMSLESVPAGLLAALHQKFGEPDVADKEHEEWLGKDASLAVWTRTGRVVLQRPSAVAALEKARQGQAAAAKAEAEAAKREQQAGRLLDL